MTSSEKPARSVGQRMGIAAVILAVSVLLSRVLGFLREAVIAYTHGASAATDAYYAAFTLPDLMNYFLAGGTLSITFIPLFSSFVTRGDEEGGWKLFSRVVQLPCPIPSPAPSPSTGPSRSSAAALPGRASPMR